MKKNPHFVITNSYWPVVVLVVLIAAAIFANAGFLKGVPDTGGDIRVSPKTTPGIRTGNQAPVIAHRSASTALNVQEGISRVVALVKPSVVTVSRIATTQQRTSAGGLTYIRPFSSGRQVTGSGIIIDRNGYVVTTFRTVGKDTVVKVKLFSGGRDEFHADVIGVDSKTDLAVLKIRGAGTFPTAVLGNSDLLEVGDFVFAIGSPYGFSNTVTMGIVSSNNRSININGINFPDMIQTDAPVNSGNDGGPLINIKGEVVGINLACFMPDNQFSGIGFAIPINDIMTFINSNI